MAKLRRGDSWHAHHLKIFPEEVTPLDVVAGPSLEINAILERCTPLTPYHPNPTGTAELCDPDVLADRLDPVT